MAWHIVEKLIEQSGDHSTLVGKIWVTSFFVIRFLIVESIASGTWDGKDSQGEFVCNTESPGCKNVCFNEFSPVDLTRFWSLQILASALPSIIFIVYTAHKMEQVHKVVELRKTLKIKQKEEEKRIRMEEKIDNNEDNDDSDDSEEDEGDAIATKAPQSHDVPSILFVVYFVTVVCRVLVEVGFMIAQYYLYTFKFMMPELWQCQHWPCPNVVDCFVLRPKEKTIMICIFYATGCIMIGLSIWELFHLVSKLPDAWRKRGDDITKHVREGPNFGETDYAEWAPGTEFVAERPGGYPDATGLPVLYLEEANPGRRRRRRRRRNRY